MLGLWISRLISLSVSFSRTDFISFTGNFLFTWTDTELCFGFSSRFVEIDARTTSCVFTIRTRWPLFPAWPERYNLILVDTLQLIGLNSHVRSKIKTYDIAFHDCMLLLLSIYRLAYVCTDFQNPQNTIQYTLTSQYKVLKLIKTQRNIRIDVLTAFLCVAWFLFNIFLSFTYLNLSESGTTTTWFCASWPDARWFRFEF